MLITPSRLPGADFVINPYIGCGFGCKYCYAKFMAKFVAGKYGLTNDAKKLRQNWGNWVIPKTHDVKLFAKELKQKYKKLTGKTVLMASVTDPYQPLEAKLKLTRQILEAWLNVSPKTTLEILTRSSLILRDIDILLKIFRNQKLNIGISISVLPRAIFRDIEPKAPLPKVRLKILEKLQKAGLKPYAFIAPVWPGELKQLKTIVSALRKHDLPIRYIELLNQNARRNFNVEFSNQEVAEIRKLEGVGKVIEH